MRNPTEKRPATFARITRRRFLFGMALFGSAVLGDGFLRQTTAFEIRRTELATGRLPAGETLRVAHLSDLHLHRFDDYFRTIAEATNALRPDVILLTGDYVEEARNLDGVLAFLRSLSAPAGIFAVQGNWEYWALIEGESLRRSFAAAGVELLNDRRASLGWKGATVSLLGLDYPSSSEAVAKLVDTTDGGHLNIVLSHVPAFHHEALGDVADLVVCGHTHGGQVRLPGVRPVHLPRHSGRFVDGLYRVGRHGTPLYVSRGIGTSLLPLRLFCPPEISLITLRGSRLTAAGSRAVRRSRT